MTNTPGRMIFNHYTLPDDTTAGYYADEQVVQLDAGTEFPRTSRQLRALGALDPQPVASGSVFGDSLNWGYREYIVHRLLNSDEGTDPLGKRPPQPVSAATRAAQLATLTIVDRPPQPEDLRLCLFNVLAATEWYATPDTLVPMTDAIDALCTIAEKMLAEPTPGMTIRLARNKITTGSIQKWRELAEAARIAKREADAVAPAPPVTQADIDVWDGIAITLFEQFVDAVEDARRLDPAIPAPSIIGLRNWFGRRSNKDESPENPPDAASSGTTP